jgi:hypothetical protein
LDWDRSALPSPFMSSKFSIVKIVVDRSRGLLRRLKFEDVEEIVFMRWMKKVDFLQLDMMSNSKALYQTNKQTQPDDRQIRRDKMLSF